MSQTYNTTSEMKVILNHHCGDDLTAVNSARRSFGKESDWLTVNDEEYDEVVHGKAYGDYPIRANGNQFLKKADHNLLKYLVRGIKTSEYNEMLTLLVESTDRTEIEKLIWTFRKTAEHSAPFAHSFISLNCEAPIFLHRQMIKHKFMICSEFSRRYVTDNIRIYLPLVHRFIAEDIKQGSSSNGINTHTLDELLKIENNMSLIDHITQSVALYDTMIDKQNICPEQARAYLPLSLMTSWTWSGSLTAMTDMCNLRLDSHSQLEARLLAQEVREILYKLYPISARLLIDPANNL